MGYLGTPIDTTNQFQSLQGKRFNGDNSTTDFTLDVAPGSTLDIEVFVGNVRQDPNSAYTVSGTTLSFTGAPPSGTNNIYVVHQAKSVGTITPGANTVGVTELNLSDGSNGQALTTNGSGTLAFSTISGTTINNNADNRVITGSGTANTLEGEANLTFDGTDLDIGASAKISSNGAIANFSNHNGSATETALGTSDGNEKVRCFNDGKITFESSGTEKMRINSNINIGNTSSVSTRVESNRPGTGEQTHINFNNANGTVGTIKTSGSGTQFNTSSDYRLKENEVAISDGITRLKTLKPYRFNFKADADTTVDGFFAHEVTAVPEAISGTKDAMAVETRYTADDVETQGDNPSKKVGDAKTYSTTEIDAQGIDQAKLVPLLTSALQEAITKIETLEARVQTLEE